MALLVGKQAPDFTTNAYYQGKFQNISLSDFQGGWVILLFYPGDFTFVCATEVAAAAEDYDAFESLGATPITVSVDSPYVHKAWAEHELGKITEKPLTFPMAADVAGKVGTLYGVYDDELTFDHRGCFIIDPDGVLQSVIINSPMVGRSFEEVFRILVGLVHVRKNQLDGLPCGWLPGDKVLALTPDMVGKINGVWTTANMSIGKFQRSEGGGVWTSSRMSFDIPKK
ncbi:MAG TPA: peroxiredoxin [Telmatospirillum sp.]|nr:peroxiredoxin [Telmatospirillum sp.]